MRSNVENGVFPYEVSDYDRAYGLHWHTWNAEGVEFAQTRRHEGRSCVGLLNAVWALSNDAWRKVWKGDPLLVDLPEFFITAGGCQE